MTIDDVTSTLRMRDESSTVIARVLTQLGKLSEGQAKINSESKQSSSIFKQAAQNALAFSGVYVGFQALQSALSGAKAAIIGTNAELETSRLQFETLTGSAMRANTIVSDLFEFAKKTPFETGPIIQASRMLQTFGGDALNTKENLTSIGNAAAAVSAPINELGFWIGRLYSSVQAGRPFGEAAMRLQELAVLSPKARNEMEALQKSGGKATDVWKVLQTELGRFTGAMAKQSQTWSGVISTFNDSINLAAAKMFQPLFVAMRDTIGDINGLLDSGTFTNFVTLIGDTVRDGLAGAAAWFAPLKQAVMEAAQTLREAFSGGDLRATFAEIGRTVGTVAVPAIQALAFIIKTLADVIASAKGAWDALPDFFKNWALDIAKVTLAFWALKTAFDALTLSFGATAVGGAVKAASAIGAVEVATTLAAAAVGVLTTALGYVVAPFAVLFKALSAVAAGVTGLTASASPFVAAFGAVASAVSAVVVVAGSATAVFLALKNAVLLWSESTDRARQANDELAVHQTMLAKATELSGKNFRDAVPGSTQFAEALEVMRKHAETLRGPMAAFTENLNASKKALADAGLSFDDMTTAMERNTAMTALSKDQQMVLKAQLDTLVAAARAAGTTVPPNILSIREQLEGLLKTSTEATPPISKLTKAITELVKSSGFGAAKDEALKYYSALQQLGGVQQVGAEFVSKTNDATLAYMDAARRAGQSTEKWAGSLLTLREFLQEGWLSVNQFGAAIRNLSQLQLPTNITSLFEGKLDFGQVISQDTLDNVTASRLKFNFEPFLDVEAGRVQLGEYFKKVGQGLGSGTFANFSAAFSSLPGSIIKAVQGGGNIGKTIGASLGSGIATDLGASLTKRLGSGLLTKGLSSALGAALPIVGSLVGEFGAKLFGKLFGPSAAEKANTLREKILEQVGGLDALKKAADAAGVSLDGLTKARREKDVEKAWKQIQAQIAAAKVRLDEFKSALEKLKPGELASEGLLQQIAGAKTGDEKALVGEFLKSQTKIAADGLATLTGLFAKEIADIKAKKLDEIELRIKAEGISDEDAKKLRDNLDFSGTIEENKTRFANLQTITQAVFSSMIANGASFASAMALAGPALDALSTAATTLGLTLPAPLASLVGMRDALKAASGEFAALDAANAIMASLGNTAGLTEESFGGLARTAFDAFHKLELQGKGGVDAARAIAPQLQNIWQLQEKFGFKVDESTQGLIDFAKESGLIGPQFKTDTQKMTDAIGGLIDKIGELINRLPDIVSAAGDAAAGLVNAFDVNIPAPSFSGDAGYAGFPTGSGGIRNFGAGRRVTLHGREGVFTEQQIQGLMARARDASAGSAGYGGPVELNLNVDGFLLTRVVAERLGRTTDLYVGR